MGSRANIFVLRHGYDLTAYYSRYAANQLHRELAYGPDVAMAWIRMLDDTDEPEMGIIDEVFCEGGAFIDLEKRKLVWFGGEQTCYDTDYRRAVMAVMRETWRGWTVRWASRGNVDVVLAAFGRFDRDRLVRMPNEPTKLYWPSDGLPSGTLVSWQKDGIRHVRRVEASWEVCLNQAEFMDLPNTPQMPWCTQWPLSGGLHVDFDQRIFRFWWSEPTSVDMDRVPGAWPGWTVCDDVDNPELHLELIKDIAPLKRPSFETNARCFVDSLKHDLEQQRKRLARDPAWLSCMDVVASLDKRLADGWIPDVNAS